MPASPDFGHVLIMDEKTFIIQPDPDAPGLSVSIYGVDASGAPVQLPVVTEKPVTLFLNKQEIVTSMTLGDWVAELAVGYFLNQNMLAPDDEIIGIDEVPRAPERDPFEPHQPLLKREASSS